MVPVNSSIIIKVICLLGFLVITQAEYANAQSRVCRQLERQLSRVSTGIQTSPSIQYRQYENAIRDQRAQLSKTRRIAARNDCRISRFNLRGRCGRLNSSIQQMQANLSKLEQTKSRLGPSRADAGSQRNQILLNMRQRGCSTRSDEFRESSSSQRERPRRRNLFEQIFGRRIYREDGRRIFDEFEPERQIEGMGTGPFRTMCVRTCDGYYFPISFSTSRNNFDADEITCESRCPGAEAQLFYHSMPGQDSEQMISYRQDIPYEQQPYAFIYRKKIDKQCSCNFSQAGLAELAELEAERSIEQDEIDEEVRVLIGLPRFRQDRYINPEALSNEIGGFSLANLEQLGNISQQSAGGKYSKNGENKRIRIVGPSFFPVQ